jgi:hypothetical protein
MRIEADATYTLPLPDRQDFAFTEGRHIGAEAEAPWLGVQRFMDEVFDVLEKGQLHYGKRCPPTLARWCARSAIA